MTLASTTNLNATTPSPPSGRQNIVFADDSGSPTVNISGIDPLMVGDSGSGGTAGNVPAPPTGSAAAGKYLKADGTWAVPPGAGLGTFVDELIVMTGTSGSFSHAPGTLIGLFKNGARLSALTSPADYSAVGATITLTVAAETEDDFEAVYFY